MMKELCKSWTITLYPREPLLDIYFILREKNMLKKKYVDPHRGRVALNILFKLPHTLLNIIIV